MALPPPPAAQTWTVDCPEVPACARAWRPDAHVIKLSDTAATKVRVLLVR